MWIRFGESLDLPDPSMNHKNVNPQHPNSDTITVRVVTEHRFHFYNECQPSNETLLLLVLTHPPQQIKQSRRTNEEKSDRFL